MTRTIHSPRAANFCDSIRKAILNPINCCQHGCNSNLYVLQTGLTSLPSQRKSALPHKLLIISRDQSVKQLSREPHQNLLFSQTSIIEGSFRGCIIFMSSILSCSPEIIEKMASSCLHQVEMPNVEGEFKFLNGINCTISFSNVMSPLCLKVKFTQMIKSRRKSRALVNSCDN